MSHSLGITHSEGRSIVNVIYKLQVYFLSNKDNDNSNNSHNRNDFNNLHDHYV
jgi:hypothetical protein